MSNTATHLASVLPEKQGKTTVRERSLSPLESGEVCISITATAINPIDWKLRDWGISLEKYPAVLGSDAAGVIEKVGPGVEGFAKGERVFFQGIPGNYDSSTFQQYCKMPAELLAKTPRNAKEEEVAGVLLATMAALTALYDTSGYGLRPLLWEAGGDKAGEGKAIVIIGGSSSVGQYAIQLARLAGFSQIVTNSNPRHIDHLKALGATHVLDRGKAGADDIVEAIGELPLEVIFDTISIPDTQLLAVKIAQAAAKVEKALVVRINLDDTAPAALKQSEKAPKVEIRGTDGSGSAPRLRYISESAMKYFGGENGAIARGSFVPNRVVIVPGGLEGIEAGLDQSKGGVSGVKLVIQP